MELIAGRTSIEGLVLVGPKIVLVRDSNGAINVGPWVDRLIGRLQRAQGKTATGADDKGTTESATSRFSPIDVKRVRWIDGALTAEDRVNDIVVAATSIQGSWQEGNNAELSMRDVSVKSPRLKSALSFDVVRFSGPIDSKRALPPVRVEGGTANVPPGIEFSGIRGAIVSDLSPEKRRIYIDMDGSYGGATTTLWAASGWFAPVTLQG